MPSVRFDPLCVHWTVVYNVSDSFCLIFREQEEDSGFVYHWLSWNFIGVLPSSCTCTPQSCFFFKLRVFALFMGVVYDFKYSKSCFPRLSFYLPPLLFIYFFKNPSLLLVCHPTFTPLLSILLLTFVLLSSLRFSRCSLSPEVSNILRKETLVQLLNQANKTLLLWNTSGCCLFFFFCHLFHFM